MEFQLSYFKSWKMLLWKCYTQYVSKFGKLSSGHRTEKGQFSFQSQRKAVTKNVQTTAQLHSHASKLMLKISPSQASAIRELPDVSDFIFLGSKITVDDDCNHEIKRYLLLGRKAMINLDNILKSRHITADKGPSSQGYGFFSSHVWM